MRLIFILESDKPRRIFKLIGEIMRQRDNKTIIFAETKRGVDDLTRNLRRDGYTASSSTTRIAHCRPGSLPCASTATRPSRSATGC